MSHRSFSCALFALATLAAAPSSQVPPGDTALFRDVFSMSDPLQILDVDTGQTSTVAVTPFPQPGPTAAIDPVTGVLYTSSFFDGAAMSYELDGLASATADTFGDLQVPPLMVSIALDGNGNLIALTSGEELYRFERGTGNTIFLGDLPPGEPSLMEIDAASNRMWMISIQGTLHELYEFDLADPDLEPTLLDEWSSGFVSSISYDASRDALFMSTSSINGRLMRFELDEGQLVYYDADTLPAGSFFSLDYDRARDLVHLIGSDGDNPATYYTFDPRTLHLEPVSGNAGEERALIRVNDFLDSTTVFPLRPKAGEAFTLEVAAHGEAGELGAVFAVTINGSPITPLLLASGPCDSGGISRASYPIPCILSAGDRVGFVAVRLSQELGNFVVAPPAVLETVP